MAQDSSSTTRGTEICPSREAGATRVTASAPRTGPGSVGAQGRFVDHAGVVDGRGQVGVSQRLEVAQDLDELRRVERLLLGREAESGELREVVDVETFGHGDQRRTVQPAPFSSVAMTTPRAWLVSSSVSVRAA
jgi:hypothetical protein